MLTQSKTFSSVPQFELVNNFSNNANNLEEFEISRDENESQLMVT